MLTPLPDFTEKKTTEHSHRHCMVHTVILKARNIFQVVIPFEVNRVYVFYVQFTKQKYLVKCVTKKYQNGIRNTLLFATVTRIILKLDVHQPGQ